MSASSIASFLATLALSKAKQEAQNVNTSGTNLINQFGKTLGAAYLPTGQTVAQTDQAINQGLTDITGQTKVGASPLFTGQNKSLGDAGLNALGVIAPIAGGVEAVGSGEAPAPETEETPPSQLGGLQRMNFPEDEPMTPGMIPPSQRADYSAPASYYKDVPAQPNPPDNGEAVLPPIQPFKNASNLPPIPEQPNTDYAPRSSYVKPTPEEINPHYDATAETGKPGAIRIQPNDELNGPRKAVIAQSAVDNIPGTTATEKFTNAEARVAQLGQQRDTIAAQSTALIPESQIREDYYNQIAPYIAPPNTSPTGSQVTPAEAQTMVDNQIAQYQAKNGITPSIDPETQQPSYTVAQVAQMKDQANLYGKKLLEARGNGVSLTPAQQIELAGRDGLQTTLKNAAPDVAKITQEQSGIYDAIPDLSKQAQQEYMTQQNNLPLIQKVGNVLKNPLSLIPISTEIARGGKDIQNVVGGIGHIAGSLGGALEQKLHPQSQQQTSVSENAPLPPVMFPDVQTDNQGHVQLPPASTGSSPFMSEQAREQAEANLTPGTPAYQKIEQQFSADQAMASKQATPAVSDFMKIAPAVLTNGNALSDDIGSGVVPMQLLHQFDTLNDAATKVNPKYQKAVSALDGFNTNFDSLYKTITGNDPTANLLISTKDYPQQAQAKLQYMMNFLAGTYGRYQDAYAATTSPSGSLSPQGAVQPSASLPPIQAPNWAAMKQTTPPALGNLPPIQ